ncbi:MAG: hypothetical protein M3O46_20110 [Myxococcota bacterium]|nr:hypothetical protein [Myxococcota bacterium]
MRVPGLLLLLPLMACLQLGPGSGLGSVSSAGSGDGATTASAVANSTDAGPSGTNCFQDPVSRVILCEQIDLCAGVRVDPGAFPDCGFRMQIGAHLDLECLCGTALCPVGVPTSCDQVKPLLDAQSALVVCGQQAEGRCVDVVATDAGTVGTCDKACAADCTGSPSCIQLCGC